MKGAVQYVDQFQLIEGENEIQIFPNIPRGMYILKLVFPGREKNFKIYKQ